MTDSGTGLESALTELRSHLDARAIPHMLIGGLALAAWGLSRLTLDVDVTVWVQPDDLSSVIAELTKRFTPRTQDPEAFVRKTRTLPLETASGVRIDVLFAGFPFEREMIDRAVDRLLNRRIIRVATREDLVLTKLISPRPKDAQDIANILRDSRYELDWDYLMPLAEQLADAIQNPAILAALKLP